MSRPGAPLCETCYQIFVVLFISPQFRPPSFARAPRYVTKPASSENITMNRKNRNKFKNRFRSNVGAQKVAIWNVLQKALYENKCVSMDEISPYKPRAVVVSASSSSSSSSSLCGFLRLLIYWLRSLNKFRDSRFRSFYLLLDDRQNVTKKWEVQRLIPRW